MICLKFHRLSELGKGISLHFKFCCHGNQNQNYFLLLLSMSCSIASVMSYLSENEAKNLQNGDVRIAQIPDFEMDYLENHLAH